MAADDIRAMSEALAADPQSLVALPLADALLAKGDLVAAARVASRAAARHGTRADVHDLVARIALAQGDEVRAETAWETVLVLAPRFGTAHRGLGLLCYRQGRLEEALHHLGIAHEDDPDDEGVRSAYEAVRRAIAGEPVPAPEPPPAAPAPEASARAGAPPDATMAPDALFDALLGDSAQVALLLDADGFVTAGRYETAEGTDLGAVIGAQLSGVSDEADRAMRHFGLGGWTRIVIETEAASIAMAPDGGALVLVAAPQGTPLGFVRRTLDRAAEVAHAWLGGRG